MPMVLNAHAGTKYGIPFPVYCRASFGILGANVPALLRALVACGWFGIQTWIGGWAIYKILIVFVPSWDELPTICRASASTSPQLGCFLFFWAINMLVIYKGIESIRMLLEHQGAAVDRAGARAAGLGLLRGRRLRADARQAVGVRARRAEGGPVLAVLLRRRSRRTSASGPRSRSTSPTSPATPTRSATRCSARRSGLPTTMALFSFIGVAVTSATAVIYGETIWDPVVVLSKFQNPVVLVVAMLVALPRHAGDEHRGQRGQPGQRFRPPLAAVDFVPHRRLHHRRDRHR